MVLVITNQKELRREALKPRKDITFLLERSKTAFFSTTGVPVSRIAAAEKWLTENAPRMWRYDVLSRAGLGPYNHYVLTMSIDTAIAFKFYFLTEQ